MGAFLLASLGIATSAFLLRDSTNAASRQTRKVPPDIEPLANRADVIGEWKRVDFPDAAIPVNWRTFSATGEFRVRYGDVVHWGTFHFIDGSTIETIEGHDGAVNGWTIGRADGNLVLIHPKNGWMEQYVSVPVGTLQP